MPPETVIYGAGVLAAAVMILLLGAVYCRITGKHLWSAWYGVTMKIDRRRCRICGRQEHAYSDYWLRITQPVEFGTTPLPVQTTDTSAIPRLPSGRYVSMPAPPRHGRVIEHDDTPNTAPIAV